jgi:hypothetical protein
MARGELVATRKAENVYRLIVLLLQLTIEVLALGFPAFINQSPMVYPDTRSYYMGGVAAVQKVASLFHHAAGVASPDSIEETLQKARGVRSAFYSLFVYLPAVTGSLWLVFLLQAASVIAVLRFAVPLVCPGRGRGWDMTAFIIGLSFITTLSWVTSDTMPDIFTPLMAICIAVSIICYQQLDSKMRVWMGIVIAAFLVMHISNLLIALCLLLVGMVLYRVMWRRYVPTVAGIIGGVLAMLFVGIVGFHELSIAPQAPPFLLSRSIADGPAKLYLHQHCPSVGLVLCNYLDKLDEPADTFVWDKEQGVYSAVSPEVQARIRAEEKKIYIGAALEHPWLQAWTMSRNAFGQLILFSSHEYMIPSWAEYNATNMTLHMPEQGLWQTLISIGQYLVVLTSLWFIVITWRRDLRSRLTTKNLTVMMLATVVIEASVGAISMPAPRYEARVIWLIPMMAALIWASTRSGSMQTRGVHYAANATVSSSFAGQKPG